MKILFLFIIQLFLIEAVVAADQMKYALVRRIQGLESVNDVLGRQLQSLTMKVITTKSDYELLLSAQEPPTATPMKMVALESEVARIKDRYRIEARLIDLKKNEVINKASMDNIRESDLARLFQAALESLFIKDAKLKEEAEKLEKEKREKPKTLPQTTFVKPQPHSSIDFKKRIMGIKSDTDQAVEAVAEDNAKESEATAKKKQPNDNTPQLLPMKNSSVAKNDPDPGAKGREYPRNYAFGATHESRQIRSDYLVGTLTKAQFLKIDGQIFQPLHYLDGQIKARADLSYAKAITSEVEPPALYSAGLTLGWFERMWNAHAGLLYDSSFFVNLPSPGAGLQMQSLNTIWMKIQGEYLMEIKGKPWVAGLSYAMPMTATSDFEPLKDASSWSGAAFSLQIVPPLSYKDWKTKFSLDQVNLNSQGARSFTLNEMRYGLSVWRSL